MALICSCSYGTYLYLIFIWFYLSHMTNQISFKIRVFWLKVIRVTVCFKVRSVFKFSRLKVWAYSYWRHTIFIWTLSIWIWCFVSFLVSSKLNLKKLMLIVLIGCFSNRRCLAWNSTWINLLLINLSTKTWNSGTCSSFLSNNPFNFFFQSIW